jgi:hypothetical protein
MGWRLNDMKTFIHSFIHSFSQTILINLRNLLHYIFITVQTSGLTSLPHVLRSAYVNLGKIRKPTCTSFLLSGASAQCLQLPWPGHVRSKYFLKYHWICGKYNKNPYKDSQKPRHSFFRYPANICFKEETKLRIIKTK